MGYMESGYENTCIKWKSETEWEHGRNGQCLSRCSGIKSGHRNRILSKPTYRTAAGENFAAVVLRRKVRI